MVLGTPTAIGANSHSTGSNTSITVGAGGVPGGAAIVVGVTSSSIFNNGPEPNLTMTDTKSNLYQMAVLESSTVIYICQNCNALVSGDKITFNLGDSAMTATYLTGVVDIDMNVLSTTDIDTTAGNTFSYTITSGTPQVANEIFFGYAAIGGVTGGFNGGPPGNNWDFTYDPTWSGNSAGPIAKISLDDGTNFTGFNGQYFLNTGTGTKSWSIQTDGQAVGAFGSGAIIIGFSGTALPTPLITTVAYVSSNSNGPTLPSLTATIGSYITSSNLINSNGASSIPQGRLLIAVVQEGFTNSASSLGTFSDSANNQYFLANAVSSNTMTASANHFSTLQVYYCHRCNAMGAGNTFTYIPHSSDSASQIFVGYANPSGGLDAAVSNTVNANTLNNSGAIHTPFISGTPVINNELILAVIGYASNATNVDVAGFNQANAAVGWNSPSFPSTSIPVLGFGLLGIGALKNSGTSTVSFNPSQVANTDLNYGMLMLGFKPVAARNRGTIVF